MHAVVIAALPHATATRSTVEHALHVFEKGVLTCLAAAKGLPHMPPCSAGTADQQGTTFPHSSPGIPLSATPPTPHGKRHAGHMCPQISTRLHAACTVQRAAMLGHTLLGPWSECAVAPHSSFGPCYGLPHRSCCPPLGTFMAISTPFLGRGTPPAVGEHSGLLGGCRGPAVHGR